MNLETNRTNLEGNDADLEEPRGALRRGEERVRRPENTTSGTTSSAAARALKGEGGLARLVDAFVERLRVRAYAKGTLVVYGNCLRDFVAFMATLGVADARGVLRLHVDRYGESLVHRKLAACTRSQRLRVVYAFFFDLVARGVLIVNPAVRGREFARALSLPRRVPGVREVARLIDSIDCDSLHGKRDRALLEVLYGSALRASELVSLTMDDIDRRSGVVRVRNGKGGRERRTPLTAAACEAVAVYVRDVRSLWASPAERALFVTKHGTSMTTWTLRAMLDRRELIARLEHASAHAFRHAAATHMVSSGADIRFVQEMLGHARLTTTQIYTRVRPLDVKATHQCSHPREVAS